METKIGKLINEEKVDAFLAYRTVNGTPYPFLFTKYNLHLLEPWRPFATRYPIVKMLLALSRAQPQKRYGILVRGCEERGLREIFKWQQIDEKRVVVLGQACNAELAQACICKKPYPDTLDYGEPMAGVTENRNLERLEGLQAQDRLGWWLAQFNRCIKCYGCRDVCPVCFCADCSLEHDLLIAREKLPPDASFHLVRAVHMAGRCIDCGLCETVCPAHIPLRSLFKKVNALVSDIFGYEPGFMEEKSPFSLLGEEAALPEGPR